MRFVIICLCIVLSSYLIGKFWHIRTIQKVKKTFKEETIEFVYTFSPFPIIVISYILALTYGNIITLFQNPDIHRIYNLTQGNKYFILILLLIIHIGIINSFSYIFLQTNKRLIQSVLFNFSMENYTRNIIPLTDITFFEEAPARGINYDIKIHAKHKKTCLIRFFDTKKNRHYVEKLISLVSNIKE